MHLPIVDHLHLRSIPELKITAESRKTELPEQDNRKPAQLKKEKGPS